MSQERTVSTSPKVLLGTPSTTTRHVTSKWVVNKARRTSSRSRTRSSPAKVKTMSFRMDNGVAGFARVVNRDVAQKSYRDSVGRAKPAIRSMDFRTTCTCTHTQVIKSSSHPQSSQSSNQPRRTSRDEGNETERVGLCQDINSIHTSLTMSPRFVVDGLIGRRSKVWMNHELCRMVKSTFGQVVKWKRLTLVANVRVMV
jgi:hypothetical protein